MTLFQHVHQKNHTTALVKHTLLTVPSQLCEGDSTSVPVVQHEDNYTHNNCQLTQQMVLGHSSTGQALEIWTLTDTAVCWQWWSSWHKVLSVKVTII